MKSIERDLKIRENSVSEATWLIVSFQWIISHWFSHIQSNQSCSWIHQHKRIYRSNNGKNSWYVANSSTSIDSNNRIYKRLISHYQLNFTLVTPVFCSPLFLVHFRLCLCSSEQHTSIYWKWCVCVFVLFCFIHETKWK